VDLDEDVLQPFFSVDFSSQLLTKDVIHLGSKQKGRVIESWSHYKDIKKWSLASVKLEDGNTITASLKGDFVLPMNVSQQTIDEYISKIS
jgi:hypothetical protein